MVVQSLKAPIVGRATELQSCLRARIAPLLYRNTSTMQRQGTRSITHAAAGIASSPALASEQYSSLQGQQVQSALLLLHRKAGCDAGEHADVFGHATARCTWCPSSVRWTSPACGETGMWRLCSGRAPWAASSASASMITLTCSVSSQCFIPSACMSLWEAGSWRGSSAGTCCHSWRPKASRPSW